MPVLTNSRWELFAQGVAKGMTQQHAYVAAGYSATGANADTAAYRLSRNPPVFARIAELKADIAERVTEKTAESVVITRAMILGELSKLAMAPEGDEYVKASDKRGACRDYALIEGWIIQKREVGEPGDFDTVDDADTLRQRLIQRAERVGERTIAIALARRARLTNGSGGTH